MTHKTQRREENYVHLIAYLLKMRKNYQHTQNYVLNLLFHLIAID